MFRTALFLVALFATPVYAADLRVMVVRNDIAFAEIATVTVIVTNPDSDDAVDPLLTISFPRDLEIVGPIENDGWACAVSPGRIECYSIGIERHYDSFFQFKVRLPARDEGGAFPMLVRITSPTPDPDQDNNRMELRLIVPRSIRVRSAADSGPGSLRSAIEDANRNCTGEIPCHVLFEFRAGALPRVDLETPLPVVTASQTIIGANPLITGEPVHLIEINGSRLESGNGVVLRSRERGQLLVLRMVIAEFPENGVLVDRNGDDARQYEIRANRIVRNRLRGIAATAPEAFVNVWGNEIEENTRSGIALWAAGNSFISANRIVGNGGSGIFVSAGTQSTYITSNRISFHEEFGIALQKGAPRVAVIEEAMSGNGALDLDWGLDGPTPNDDDESDGILNHPTLQLAVARDGVTRIEGEFRTVPGKFGQYYMLRIIASDEPNRFGVARMERIVYNDYVPVENGRARFSLEVPYDLRGKYISAMVTAQEWAGLPDVTVSEASPALRVE